MLNNNYDTLIFDLDGTLHDSKLLVLKVHEACVTELHYKISNELFLGLFGKPIHEVREELSVNLTNDQISAFLDCYFTKLLEKVNQGEACLYTGSSEVLDILKETGWKLAICTNVHTPFIKVYREIFNLDKWFSGKNTSIYWSGKSNQENKTKEWMIQQILKELNSKAAIMVGDRKVDIDAARKNNLTTIGCLYGFGSREELKEADYFLNDIGELPELLQKIIHKENVKSR